MSITILKSSGKGFINSQTKLLWNTLQTGGDTMGEPAVPPVGDARLAQLSAAKLLALAEEAEAADEPGRSRRSELQGA